MYLSGDGESLLVGHGKEHMEFDEIILHMTNSHEVLV